MPVISMCSIRDLVLCLPKGFQIHLPNDWLNTNVLGGGASEPAGLNGSPQPGVVVLEHREPLFDIINEKDDVNNMTFRLSYQSIAMLNKIIKLLDDTGLSFNNKFRLELQPASFNNKDIKNQSYELRMNVDPVTWFNL
ncbi:unnamed protein product [Rotaria sp. Silwood1]|nr:unnamed protein product [Rotaria sp. Silwood1]CAF4915445.1 unnamed protein product [Rotaria sp. Silwood1]